MDPQKSREIVNRVVTDVGGAFAAGLGYIGDRLGLFEALARRDAWTPRELAEATRLHERYVLEWLKAMVAAEYVEHDGDSGRFFMTPEQRAVLADPGSPVFAAGAFQFALPSLLHTPRVVELFRDGGGIPFGELGEEISEAIDRMHRPWFDHLLVREWIPGVPGLTERLDHGIAVLDVGCGLGRSTVALACAFPRSRFKGIDSHAPSIRRARELAAGRAAANAAFVDTALESIPAHEKFDLVLAIDCIHDMPDPEGALRRLGGMLSDGGLVLWLEPTGSHLPLENRNPIAKMRAALSPFHCLAVSRALGGEGLGTIIGEAGARELAARAGFSRFERYDIASPVQQFFGLRR
jgi:SAM-dependent methyltransferase